MTLKSFISIPMNSSKGIEYIKYDLSRQQITLHDKSPLVDVQELLDDLHHCDLSDESTSSERSLHIPDYYEDIRKALGALKTTPHNCCSASSSECS